MPHHRYTRRCTFTGEMSLRGVLCIVSLGLVVSCTSDVPPAPSSTVGPQAVSPVDGATVAAFAQVTLVARNAVGTTAAFVNDTFEVATDPTFTTIATSITVPVGASGQTSTTLNGWQLTAGAASYWRVRATSATGAIAFSQTSRVVVKSHQLTIDVPYRDVIGGGCTLDTTTHPYVFQGTLSGDEASVTFTLTPAGGTCPECSLSLRRDGGSNMIGTILATRAILAARADQVGPLSSRGVIISADAGQRQQPAVATGRVAPDANSMTGSFDGYINSINQFGDLYVGCTGHYSWAIAAAP